MKTRTRSRKPASIGSNQSSRRPTAISPSEPRTGNFVLLLVMAWSPPAHNAGIRLGFSTRRLPHLQFQPHSGRHYWRPDSRLVEAASKQSVSPTRVKGEPYL